MENEKPTSANQGKSGPAGRRQGGGLPVHLRGVEKGTHHFPPAAFKSDVRFIRFLLKKGTRKVTQKCKKEPEAQGCIRLFVNLLNLKNIRIHKGLQTFYDFESPDGMSSARAEPAGPKGRGGVRGAEQVGWVGPRQKP